MSEQAKEIIKPDLEQKATLAIYGEICKSYHAIDDFRMKLLVCGSNETGGRRA